MSKILIITGDGGESYEALYAVHRFEEEGWEPVVAAPSRRRLNSMENVYLYDIDDLSAVINESIGDREREAEKAESIITLEVESFLKWLNELALVPAIRDIRSSVEQLRELELDRHRTWLMTLAPAERERIESLTRGLVNKLLHRILSGIREGHADRSDGIYTAEIARRLLSADLAAPGSPLVEDGDDEDDEF